MFDRRGPARNRERWRGPRGRAAVGFLVVSGILALDVARAVLQPVVHDEALTYNHFVVLAWNAVRWTFHSNNHTLNTLLVKASTTALGLSSFSLRLPALLGGLLYLLAVERLCRRVCRNTVGYTLGLLSLTVSPFVLDYLVAARGYGLALGFLLWAVVISWRWLDLPDPERPHLRRWSFPLVSLLCALSVASNLAFGFVAASVLAILWGTGFFLPETRRWHAMMGSAAMLCLPGGILFLLIDPGVFRMRAGALFFGAHTWGATLSSLLEAQFGGLSAPWVSPSLHLVLTTAVSLLLLLLAGLVAWAIAQRILSSRSNQPGDDAERSTGRWLLWTVSVLGMTVLLHTLSHELVGLLLPMDRTGIFFVPLTLLTILLVPGSQPAGSFRRTSRAFVGGTLALFVALYLCFGHVRYFEQWRYDADSRNVFLAVLELATQHPGATIGNDWLLEPSLNFYRTFYHATALPPFTRKPPTIDDTVFALLPLRSEHDRSLMATLPLRVVLADPLSGAVVATTYRSSERDAPSPPAGHGPD